ncbi:hypothetical protein Ae201684P_001194 [Aphanomyces euteiches]|uniref:Uncharacterized protein n=1 Tax=Aphanomyces euteiches TaxID=100861 RepID=A0A6G0WGT7_9STRA|nr:hypothetical protein Ae201684_015366 [Aphanomyces euteiches]KAH9097718.1 hypothetical protein Ae201684P_001194 [Aphanomyces euteiches]
MQGVPADVSCFTKIFSLRHGSHVKKIESEAKINEWLVIVRTSRVSLSIYKYGNKIMTKDHFVEFTAACIAPPSQDRSGAPSEATIQKFIVKLHDKWDSTWEGDYPKWRLWATHIVKPPSLAWESRVHQGPPPHVFARLRPKTSLHEAQIERFGRQMRTALDVVLGSIAELDQLNAAIEQINNAVDIVEERMKLFQQALLSKREILVVHGKRYITDPRE